jgi:hypothetical protein
MVMIFVVFVPLFLFSLFIPSPSNNARAFQLIVSKEELETIEIARNLHVST